MKTSDTPHPKYQKPSYILMVMSVSAFFAEMIIMFLLHHMIELPPIVEGLINALLLVGMLYPVLYIFLFRPLLLPIGERRKVEKDIDLLAKFPTENPNPVLRIRKDGTIQFANKASKPILAEFGSASGQFVTDEWKKQIKEIYNSQEPKEVQLQRRGRIFSLTITPFADTDYLYVYGRDVTERRQISNEREAISIISQLFLTAESLESIYSKLPEILSTQFQFPIVAVELYDKDAQNMVFVGTVGIPKEEGSEPMAVPVGQTISGTVATTGKAVFELNAGTRPDYQYDTLRKLNVETFICVPMRDRGEIFGTLALADPDNYPRALSLVDTLQVIANHLAQEIERKKAEDKLAAQTYLSRVLLNNLPCIALLMRPGTREIVASNEAAIEVGAVPGKQCFSTWGQRDDPCPWCFAPETWATGENRHVEVRALNTVWDAYWVSITEDLYLHYAFDITDRKQVEEKLQLFCNLIERSNDAIFVTDPETGNFSDVNNTACVSLGYTREELLSMSIFDIEVVMSSKEKWQEYVKKVKKEGDLIVGGINKRKDGTTFPIEASVTYLIYDKGDCILGMVRDISERKQVEEGLKESEEKYRRLIETANDAIFIADAESGEIIDVNKKAEELIGLPAEEIIGMHQTQLHPKEEAERYANIFQEHIQKRGNVKADVFVVHKDGYRIPVEISASTTVVGGKKIIQGIFRDATERKQAEEELRASEEKFRNIFDNANVMIWGCYADGRIKLFNKEAERLLGYSQEEILGKENLLLHPPEEREEIIEKFSSHRDGELKRDLEVGIYTKDGKKLKGLLAQATFKDASGQDFYVALTQDITERKRAEESLKKAYDELELRVEERTADLANANGELHAEVIEHKHTGKALERKNHIQNVLNAMLKISIESQDLEEILGRILEQIVSVPWLAFGSRGVIFLVEDSPDELVMKASRECSDKLKKMCAKVPFGRCICGKAALTQKLQFVSCIDERHEISYKGMLPHGHYCFPIQSGGNTLGVLNLYVEEGHQRNREEEEFLYAITNVLAGIIERKRAELALTKYQHQLEGVVKERTTELTKVNEDLKLDVTERERVEDELQHSVQKLRKSLAAIVTAMALTLETRDPYTAGHQRRVSEIARAIAQEMGFSEEKIDGIRMAALIHDLGKVSVPTEILSKPGILTELEFEIVRTHARAGYDILKKIDFPWPLADIVLQHHERMNGSGYPSGLKGDEIFIEARIIAVADVVEAIASHRPYRPALGIEEALEEILQNKGILYDAKVVDICLMLFKDKGFDLS